jgi:hypothetical protein
VRASKWKEQPVQRSRGRRTRFGESWRRKLVRKVGEVLC